MRTLPLFIAVGLLCCAQPGAAAGPSAKRCGASWSKANKTCGTACKSNAVCGGQKCFADLSLAPCSSTAGGAGATPDKVDSQFGRDLGTGGQVRDDLAAGSRAQFSIFLLALSWTPEFCSTHPEKEECDNLGTSFAGTHLAIHGLWPNYSDAEAAGLGANSAAYPTFCGPYAQCKGKNPPAFCLPKPSTIPADLAKFGPGYTSDDNFLANHEWPKHGSCTGLEPRPYFQAAVDTLLRNPGDQGTPQLILDHPGQSVELAKLAAAYSAGTVVFGCDPNCKLSAVSTCWTNDHGKPGEPTACPENVTRSAYDNGCVTSRCATVDLASFTPGGGSGGGTDGSGGTGGSGGHGGNSCNVNGKGPACTNDAQCKSQGYVRCAKSSHCCTTVP